MPQVPKASKTDKANGEVRQLSAVPADRVACFGVNVKAPDLIKAPANQCRPDLGIVGGFVPADGVLQLDVPKGLGRVFEVFMYLLPSGVNGPCPQMGMGFAAAEMANIYFVGTSDPLNLSKPIEEVTINVSFPGVSQTLASTRGYPASCSLAGAHNQPTPYSVSSAAGVASNASYQMRARVAGEPVAVLSGGNFKIVVKH